MAQIIPILSAGAAQGLITRAAPLLLDRLGAKTVGRFGAVGAMKDAFLAGEPCDVIVLTDAMIRSMLEDGSLEANSSAGLGTVYTGIAVPSGRPMPDISSVESLAEAFQRASSIWLPDTERSTAGLHAMKVLKALQLDTSLRDRLKVFPNGATAMSAMAASGEHAAIGCTQLSEILFTEGVLAVGPLPRTFELGTVYTAAVSRQASNPTLAKALINLLAEPANSELRKMCGFE